MKALHPKKELKYELEYYKRLKKKKRTKEDEIIIDIWEAYQVCKFHARQSQEYHLSRSDPM